MSGRHSQGAANAGRHTRRSSLGLAGDAPAPMQPLTTSASAEFVNSVPVSSGSGRNGSQSPQQATSSALINTSALSNASALRHLGGSDQDSPGPTALLIPTDRPLEDLEQWLPTMARLRVDKEVVLSGYALYGIRSW